MLNCYVEILITLVTLVMGCLVIKLMVILCRDSKVRQRKATSFLKFWVLLFMLLTNLMQVAHYTVAMPQYLRTQLSFVEVLIKNIAVFLMIYFVFKKACKYLKREQRKRWLRTITIIFAVGIPINLALLL